MANPTDRPQALPPETGAAARFADLVLRGRWLWPLLAIALTALALARIEAIWPLDPTARVFFAPENPDRQALDRFEQVFAKDDTLMIVVTPPDGDIFSPDSLRVIGEITERAWRLPLVRKVDSLTNFQHTAADGDDLLVRDLVPDPSQVTPEQAAEARALAADRPELRGLMIPPAEDVTQVSVTFKLPERDETEVPAIVAAAEAMVAEVLAANPGLELRLTGSVMINNQYAVAGQQDGQTLMGPMFLVILAVIFVALRSVLATLAVTVVILLSAIAGLGALGWAGLPLNSVTILAPLYIMALAVASTVHVLASCRQSMIETADRRVWVRRALARHAPAIVVACLTTAIGFYSLAFSISPPFRQLGFIVGTGVLASLLYTLTLLPSLILALPIARQRTPAPASRAMAWLGDRVAAGWRTILPASLAVVVLAVAGISQIKLEDDFLRYFDERYEFRQATDYAEDRLTGLSVLEFPLPSGETQGINEPAYLAEVDAFADWLRVQPKVTNVRTLTDTIKRLNMNMNGDDPAYYRLPATRDEASQYLFLYELSLGYGSDLTDRIDIDRSTMRVSVGLARATTAEMNALTDRAAAWIEMNAPIIQAAWERAHPDLPEVTPTGVVHVFNLISERDVRAMLTGTALALVAISGLIAVALGSVRLGLISLAPNLVPAAMAFGLWGYSVGAVTLAIAVVSAATFGIVVDDTVHFLSSYAKRRREGLSPEEAVRRSFRDVGMALLLTSAGLVAGFAVLAQSGFAVNGDMAKLTALTILLALAADFLMLPALLIWLDRRRSPMTVTPAAAATAAALMIALIASAPSARADTPEAKGLAIAEEADRRDLGFGDTRVEGEMVLRDARGGESRRLFETLTRERPEPTLGDQSVIVFSEPRDIRGTALLTHANVEPADDDQWLYLPAVKRVKRISSSNRTGKFVSSEFSYEDLGSVEVADDEHRWLRDEPCPTESALTCHVLEQRPKNPRSGYSKRVAWIDGAEFRLQQVEYFNRAGEFEKRLRFTGYKQYLGRYWRAARLEMVNQQTGKSTDLIWQDYKFQTGLSEGDFDAQRLEKMAR